MRFFKKNKGFTLIEVIVAMTIFTFVIAMSSLIWAKLMSGSTTGVEASDVFLRQKLSNMITWLKEDSDTAEVVFGFEGEIEKNGSPYTDIEYLLPLGTNLRSLSEDNFLVTCLDSADPLTSGISTDSSLRAYTLFFLGDFPSVISIWHVTTLQSDSDLIHTITRVGTDMAPNSLTWTSEDFSIESPDFLPVLNRINDVYVVNFPNPLAVAENNIVGQEVLFYVNIPQL
mgnify:CR=1 FL=1